MLTYFVLAYLWAIEQTSAQILGYLQNRVPDRVLKRVPGYPFGNYFEAAIIAT